MAPTRITLVPEVGAYVLAKDPGQVQTRSGATRNTCRPSQIDVALENGITQSGREAGTIVGDSDAKRLSFCHTPDRHPAPAVPDGVADEDMKDLTKDVRVGLYLDVGHCDLQISPSLLVFDRDHQRLVPGAALLPMWGELVGNLDQKALSRPVLDLLETHGRRRRLLMAKKAGPSGSPEDQHDQGGHDEADDDLGCGYRPHHRLVIGRIHEVFTVGGTDAGSGSDQCQR
jgi:hypothetical protein